MKEIGGYFELERFRGREYHCGAISLVHGRACLTYLIQARKINHLYLPWFLCDCVAKVCYENQVPTTFYMIGDDFLPRHIEHVPPDAHLYMVNAYGRIDNFELARWKQRFPNLIVDNTHAFFQQPLDGVDTLYSCRKYFGVPDGAYLFTSAHLEGPIVQSHSAERMSHLLGRLENTAEKYYAPFLKNEEALSCVGLEGMSELTHNLLRGINYGQVIEVRNQNYEFLAKSLKNALPYKSVNGPFCYPFYDERGMELKRWMIQHNIFVPTYWPNVLSCADTDQTARDFAENIVPIPCDQRYSKKDMEHIIKIIMKFIP